MAGIVYSIISHKSTAAYLSSLPSLLMIARDGAVLAGPESHQNLRSAYMFNSTSPQVIATKGGVVVGYALARLYATSPLFFGKRSYVQDMLGDTMVVNEICVIQTETRQGIASSMLDQLVASRPLLTNVEFTLETENAASERLFTGMAQKHGSSITIGALSQCNWGTYVDWNVTLSKHGETGRKRLAVVNEFYESLGCNRERRRVVTRARIAQGKRV
jgi:hypothetical protein